MKHVLVAVGTVLLLMCGTVGAQTLFSGEDNDFLIGASQANIRNIQLGDIATRRAVLPSVRRLGEVMASTARQAQARLAAIAAAQRTVLPAGPSSSDQDTVRYFIEVPFSSFDDDFVNQAIHDGSKDIGNYQDEVDEGSNVPLVRYAAEQLPDLQAVYSQALLIDREIFVITGQ